MAEAVSVEVEILKAQNALAETNKSLKSITKQTLGIIGKGTVKTIKSAIRSSDLQQRTGELARAYKYKVKKDAMEANVFPMASDSKNTIFPKAMTLSYGHEGPTKRCKSWNIKGRGFVQAGKTWVNAGLYDEDVQKMIDKQLKKFWD